MTRRRMIFWFFGFLVVFLSYVDFGLLEKKGTYLSAYIATFGFVLAVASFTMRSSYSEVQRRAKELESVVGQKERELEAIVEELKATQLKLMEASKVSTVAALSAGILHQISQPITAIHGFVRFMKQEMKPDNTFYKPVCLMEEQSVYLKEMLEDLMNLIRHRTIQKTNVDVNSVIDRAVNLLLDELRIRRVDWEMDLEESIPPVYADAVHLQQVFMNIVVNAVEALSMLPRGQHRNLQITSKYDKADHKAVLYFKDNGPGIPEEERRKIFEPFFSTKDKGAGIGLALCKDLIAEHGGTIELNTAGIGVTFIIKLPCVAS